jgi:hypothetical protein
VLDSLTWTVLDATADDWESLNQILPYVREDHDAVEGSAVAEVISRLVTEGMMEEMRHAPVSPRDILADPIEYWFRMTPAGRAAWDADGSHWRAVWEARQKALAEEADA